MYMFEREDRLPRADASRQREREERYVFKGELVLEEQAQSPSFLL